MNPLKVFLYLATLAVIPIALTSAPAKRGDEINAEEDHKKIDVKHYKEPSRYFDPKKHLYHPAAPWVNPRARLKCDRFPRVCHLKGSPGHDCCKKKCVDVKTDKLNCGMCGLKCRYPEICCNGKCVNPLYDGHHCGGCHNKCDRGNFCYNGMCNYS